MFGCYRQAQNAKSFRLKQFTHSPFKFGRDLLL